MEEVKRLKSSINDANSNKKVLKKWIAEEKARMVYNSDIAHAKEEGIKEGLEKGKIELIQNMLVKSTDYAFISEVTNKTIEEIKEIANSNH